MHAILNTRISTLKSKLKILSQIDKFGNFCGFAHSLKRQIVHG